MRRSLAALLLAALLLAAAGCAPSQRRYDAAFLDLFDTVTTVVGYAPDEETFNAAARDLHDTLLEYHRLYDTYHAYDGVENLCTVNQNAGGDPVKVDRRIVELLLFCREVCELTGGKVDVTAGAVFSLWHDAREEGLQDPESARLPDESALLAASEHTGFDLLEIDEEGSAVRLLDPLARLDVGAVAKGYAVQKVCEAAPEGLLVSVGGNVFATGPRPTGGGWVVGIQDSDGDGYLHTVGLERGAVVTSGDYQRYYTVDGTRYHHIIDPDTRFPGTNWRSVTILCEDSALADALSTALFLMDEAEGRALLEQCGAEGMWMDPEGRLICSEGFQARIRE